MEKVHTYQLFFKSLRDQIPIKKINLTFQLAKEKNPNITKEALMLPPVDLDALLNKKLAYLAKRGMMYLLPPFRQKLNSKESHSSIYQRSLCFTTLYLW